MKYIITESQFEFIKESDLERWSIRRRSMEFFDKLVDEVIGRYTDICEEFSDEFDFADQIIDEVVDDFYSDYPHEWESENFWKVRDDTATWVKDNYGPGILELYSELCPED